MLPSVTSSLLKGNLCPVTDAKGSTLEVSTSFNCATNSNILFKSLVRFCLFFSGISRRASLAILFTVGISTIDFVGHFYSFITMIYFKLIWKSVSINYAYLQA